MLEDYLEYAVSLGVEEARVIDPKVVVTAPWVAHKCKYACDRYGSTRCCPPHSPTWKETRELLDSYTTAIIVRDAGWATSKIVGQLSRKLFFDGYYKALAFGAGFCTVCGREKCLMGACDHKMEAFPSMEASGIDVFATARALGMPIEVLPRIEDPHNAYGLVLVE